MDHLVLAITTLALAVLALVMTNTVLTGHALVLTILGFSAQSIVHLTAQIQNMETCIANFLGVHRTLFWSNYHFRYNKLSKKTPEGLLSGKPPKMP